MRDPPRLAVDERGGGGARGRRENLQRGGKRDGNEVGLALSGGQPRGELPLGAELQFCAAAAPFGVCAVVPKEGGEEEEEDDEGGAAGLQVHRGNTARSGLVRTQRCAQHAIAPTEQGNEKVKANTHPGPGSGVVLPALVARAAVLLGPVVLRCVEEKRRSETGLMEERFGAWVGGCSGWVGEWVGRGGRAPVRALALSVAAARRGHDARAHALRRVERLQPPAFVRLKQGLG